MNDMDRRLSISPIEAWQAIDHNGSHELQSQNYFFIEFDTTGQLDCARFELVAEEALLAHPMLRSKMIPDARDLIGPEAYWTSQPSLQGIWFDWPVGFSTDSFEGSVVNESGSAELRFPEATGDAFLLTELEPKVRFFCRFLTDDDRLAKRRHFAVQFCAAVVDPYGACLYIEDLLSRYGGLGPSRSWQAGVARIEPSKTQNAYQQRVAKLAFWTSYKLSLLTKASNRRRPHRQGATQRAEAGKRLVRSVSLHYRQSDLQQLQAGASAQNLDLKLLVLEQFGSILQGLTGERLLEFVRVYVDLRDGSHRLSSAVNLESFVTIPLSEFPVLTCEVTSSKPNENDQSIGMSETKGEETEGSSMERQWQQRYFVERVNPKLIRKLAILREYPNALQQSLQHGIGPGTPAVAFRSMGSVFQKSILPQNIEGTLQVASVQVTDLNLRMIPSPSNPAVLTYSLDRQGLMLNLSAYSDIASERLLQSIVLELDLALRAAMRPPISALTSFADYYERAKTSKAGPLWGLTIGRNVSTSPVLSGSPPTEGLRWTDRR